MNRRTFAFWSVAYVLLMMLLGGTMPSPLYVVYQRLWHFPASTLTLIYSVYAIGVIVALLFFGRLSDTIGRKQVLIPATILMALSALAFMFAQSVAWLIVGRILMGLGIGLTTSTAAAALVDLHPVGDSRRALLVSSVVTVVGLALGPLLASVFVQFVPTPNLWSFLVYLILLAIGFIGIWAIPGGRPATTQKLSFRPQFPLNNPSYVLAVATVFCSYATMGMGSSLVPSFLISLLHVSNSILGGVILFFLFVLSSVAQFVFRRFSHHVSISGGLLVMIVGLLVFLASLSTQSLALFLLGIALLGIGQGTTFMGSAALVGSTATPENRGAIMSSYFTIGYIGIGLPVLGLGFAASSLGLFGATAAFVVVFGLIYLIVAIVGWLRRKSGETPDPVEVHSLTSDIEEVLEESLRYQNTRVADLD
jgi:MFS family permease